MTFLTITRQFPNVRLRRLRRDIFSRELIAETRVLAEDLICPFFVIEGKKQRQPIASMPGIERISLDYLLLEVEALIKLGIKAIILFPFIDNSKKSLQAEHAYDPQGLMQTAIRLLKQNFPQFGVITDIALDPYTSHGQDGIIDGQGYVLNDATNAILVKQALSHAEAGADIVAPSDMMDGRIGAIRTALEQNNFIHTKILAYSAKFASHFYGPFREAVGSSTLLGKADKMQYQCDPRNKDEALHEVAMDIAEGADMIMIKPAIHYLDIIRQTKDYFRLPTLGYHVSGEYALLKAAAQAGWINERGAVLESLIAIKRAGCDAIVTYYAKQAAEWLS